MTCCKNSETSLGGAFLIWKVLAFLPQAMFGRMKPEPLLLIPEALLSLLLLEIFLAALSLSSFYPPFVLLFSNNGPTYCWVIFRWVFMRLGNGLFSKGSRDWSFIDCLRVTDPCPICRGSTICAPKVWWILLGVTGVVLILIISLDGLLFLIFAPV